jgi:magnesium transporter
VRAILFERDKVDELHDVAQMPQELKASELLWVDLDRGSLGIDTGVPDRFDLDPATCAYLAEAHDRAVFEDHGRYLHITTYAPRGDQGELSSLECVVGQNWVVTAHDHPVPVLEDFASRVSGSGDTGSLDGPGFLAALLEWVLGSYSAEFERMEANLEDFDVDAMRGNGDDDDIERLIELRRHVGKLRRALSAHRAALVALTHPELEALGDNASSERFQSLYERFEATLQEARDVREAIVGSFDVLIARGGHRTNETMKLLTLVSVILLPGTLIAGIMGMNFKIGIFERPWMFWVVVALIFSVAPVTLVVGRRQSWI